MKFTRVFYKSDDFVTAIDMSPTSRKQICCANYSGRLFLIDYERKVQRVESQLKLRKRQSAKSDTDVVEIPHVASLAFSPDGHHLLCGLHNGELVALDPNVLLELTSIIVAQLPIKAIKFSSDSSFVALYVSNNSSNFKFDYNSHVQDESSTVVVLHRDKSALDDAWRIVGKLRCHVKPICDILFLPNSSDSQHQKLAPRLISLGEDRVRLEIEFKFASTL